MSNVQCADTAVHALFVSTSDPADVAIVIRSRSAAIPCTAIATAEFPSEKIASTPSSNQRRAIPTPTSGAPSKLPGMISIGTPRTLPPKSSTAIRAATTSPGPCASAFGPVMSPRIPIRTLLSLICAQPGDAAAPARPKPNAQASTDTRMLRFPRLLSGTIWPRQATSK